MVSSGENLVSALQDGQRWCILRRFLVKSSITVRMSSFFVQSFARVQVVNAWCGGFFIFNL